MQTIIGILQFRCSMFSAKDFEWIIERCVQLSSNVEENIGTAYLDQKTMKTSLITFSRNMPYIWLP